MNVTKGLLNEIAKKLIGRTLTDKEIALVARKIDESSITLLMPLIENTIRSLNNLSIKHGIKKLLSDYKRERYTIEKLLDDIYIALKESLPERDLFIFLGKLIKKALEDYPDLIDDASYIL